MRKYYWLIVSVIVLCVVGYYTFVAFGPVKPFPSNESIALTLGVDEQDIKEVYTIAENYRYIPYEKNDAKHMSYWKFHKRKWQMISDYQGDEILSWTLKDGTEFITWHFEGEHVAKLNVYAIRDRGYHITQRENGDENARYYPQIVMKLSEDINDADAFGVIQLPKEWATFMQDEPRQESFFDFAMNGEIQSMYQWDVEDKNGDVVPTNRPSAGSGYHYISDDSTFNFVMNYQPWPVEE